MVHNRTRNELRKKGDKHREWKKVIFSNFPLKSIYQKRYLLEGEKTDSQRQGQIQKIESDSRSEIKTDYKKISVLEITQQA